MSFAKSKNGDPYAPTILIVERIHDTRPPFATGTKRIESIVGMVSDNA
jgi:hypothetical protein